MTPNISFSHFSWRQSKLGNLAEIGSSVRVHESDWTSQGIPFIRARDIVASNNQVLQPEIYISESIFNELSKRSCVLKGDVLVTGVGTIGVPYLVKDGDKFYYKDGNIIYIRSNGEIHPEFLYHYIRSYTFKKYLRSISGCGTVATYTIKNAKDTPIFFPSIEEQQKIASFFSMLDEKISIEEKKLACFKRLKKGVKRKIFSREIRFKDKFVNNTHGWKALRLRDICTSFSGGTPKSTVLAYYDGEIPFIRSGEIHGETTELKITEEGLNSSSAKMVHKGDLLYALYGATSGECDISQIEGAINQAILCIRPKSKSDINVNYLNEYLSNEKDCIVAKYLQGGQGNLSAAIVMNIMCEFPSRGEQDVITQFLDEINKKIQIAEQKLQALNKLNRFFLQTMFV